MNDDQIRDAVVNALCQVVPDADPESLEPAAALRDQLDIDSMDHLNFVVALGDRFGIEVPEADYPKLGSIDDCVAYVSRRSRPAAAGP